jgi:3-dehydrocarnitine:acetyl-CoA trimethylamine transferase
MGGYIVVGDHGLKDTPGPGSDFVSQEDRMRHVIDLCHEGLYRPDIATLDCGSLNFGDGNRAYVSTPNYLRQGAGICKDLGVKPELEVFDTGNLWFVKQMIKEGLLTAPSLIQLCMGIPYGVPADVGHLLAMVNSLPENCNWGTFAISRMQMPWAAQAVLLGGNVRVGLEDNLYLSKGVYASNAQLVEKARTIVEAMGARVLTPAQAREKLQLR